jgi:hypothetical protein
MMTAYQAARPNARPGSIGSRIRAATFRPTHIVREGKKRRVMRARQPNGPLNDTVAESNVTAHYRRKSPTPSGGA